jgi:hypothetical protein
MTTQSPAYTTEEFVLNPLPEPTLIPRLFDINYKFANVPPFPLLRRRSQSDGAVRYEIDNTVLAELIPTTVTTIKDRNNDLLPFDYYISIKGFPDIETDKGSVTITISQDPSGSWAGTTMSAKLYIRKLYPTIFGFDTIINKTTTSPAFTINPPISNNTDGIFDYTTTNSRVATIDDFGVVTINGPGDTLVTAVQRATGKFYKSGPRITTLIVTKTEPEFSVSNITKLLSDKTFTLVDPISTNTESPFNYRALNPEVARVIGNEVTIVDSGAAEFICTQIENTTYFEKSLNFFVYIYENNPNIASCNYNFGNPYISTFWSRFTPTCFPSFTTTQLDERRKVEILKHKNNVGNSTKSERYAKASRGQLIRKKGFAVQTDTFTNPNVSGLPVVGNTIVCNNTPVLCGLTTACDVPGKTMLLCYNPEVPLYNYRRQYVYKAGLQTTTNIPTLALTQPVNFTAVRGDQKLIISWGPPESNGGYTILSYVVTYSLDRVTWINFGTFPNKKMEVQTEEVVNLENNKRYYVRIYAVNRIGPSTFPATTIQNTYSVPSIPGAVDLSGGKDISLPVSWSAPTDSGGPTLIGYKLEYTSDINGIWNSITVNNLADTSVPPPTRYTITGIDNQTVYYVRVSAYNNIGYGPATAIVSTSTMKAPSPPLNLVGYASYSDILNTGVATLLDHNVQMTWDAPFDNGGTDITYYSVDYSTDGTVWINLTTTQPADTRSYKFTNINGASLGAGIQYYFRVFARNASILSPASNIIRVRTVTVPSQPYNLYQYKERDSDGIYLAFSQASSGGSAITSINVYYSRDGGNNQLFTKTLTSDVGVGILTIVLPTMYEGEQLLFDESIYGIKVFVTNVLGASAESSQSLTINPVVVTAGFM